MNNYYLGPKEDLNWMVRNIKRTKIMTKLFYDYIFSCDIAYELSFVQTISCTRFRFNPQCRSESIYAIYTDFEGNIYLSDDTEWNGGRRLVVVTYDEAKLEVYDDHTTYGILGKQFFENFCEWLNNNCFQNTKESAEEN